MQAANGAGVPAEGVIVLHEIDRDAMALKPRLVPAFTEKAAGIAMAGRGQDKNAGKAGLLDLQGRDPGTLVALGPV